MQLCKTNAYMLGNEAGDKDKHRNRPSALDVATHAVVQLEDNPLFNSGHGAVFTRDGINELEASVMVSRGYAKRAVGVMGLRRVRNPILLAKRLLEHGDEDLSSTPSVSADGGREPEDELDVPSAQGHTQLWGRTAEQLARKYGLDTVDPEYFFTQKRWDEHIRALEREKRGQGLCTWSENEYLPQGTCGAVAMDEHGVVCAATSTGGMTNKLTGRVGDTPTPGAGFWAEEWTEDGDPTAKSFWTRTMSNIKSAPGGSSLITLTEPLRGLLAECLPTPFMYTPLVPHSTTTTTRGMGASGTGNGDSFLRIAAVRTVAAMARFKPEPTRSALEKVAGPEGELQRSAEDRWDRTGEGAGGIIGVESVVVRDASGRVVDARSEVVMDFNCSGMFRAWIDIEGEPHMSVWKDDD